MEESKKEYIFRLKDKTSNFTIIYNNCLQDNTISWQAKGLFSYLMTLPNDWEIHKTELVSHSSNGRDATLKAFDELIEKGYITVEEIKGECGQFSKKIYRVFEESQGEVKIEHKKRKAKNTVTENPLTENQERKTSNGNPLTENQELLNTDKQITKELNTDNTNSSTSLSSKPPKFKPTKSEKKVTVSAKERHEQNLASLTPEELKDSEKCSELLVKIRTPLCPTHNPAENKLSWQDDFAQISKTLKISLKQIYNYLLIVQGCSYLRKLITCPKKFLEHFDKIYAEKVEGKSYQTKNQNKGGGQSFNCSSAEEYLGENF